MLVATTTGTATGLPLAAGGLSNGRTVGVLDAGGGAVGIIGAGAVGAAEADVCVGWALRMGVGVAAPAACPDNPEGGRERTVLAAMAVGSEAVPAGASHPNKESSRP